MVKYARVLFEKGDSQKGIQPRAFEKVFAVFDRDDHLTYFDALSLAASLDGKLRNDARKAVQFRGIASVPSFELWLLLHYEDIQAPIHRDDVMQRLKVHIPGYDKGAGGAFATTRAQLEIAIQRAEVLGRKFSAHDAPEPFTDIVELVKLLHTLRT